MDVLRLSFEFFLIGLMLSEEVKQLKIIIIIFIDILIYYPTNK